MKELIEKQIREFNGMYDKYSFEYEHIPKDIIKWHDVFHEVI